MDDSAAQRKRGYYGLPILKTPVWRWEVWSYFFLGGLAAGSYVVASLAILFGDARDRAVSRAGYVISFLAVLACPLLLIKDLGRPERFLNMLRVFKSESPMSVGVWGLVGFSGCATAMFFRQVFAESRGPLGIVARAVPLRWFAAAGTALGCLLGSYTGVLLSATSIPLWSRSRLLGATFLASAFSSGLSAISLLLALKRTENDGGATLHVSVDGALEHVERAKRAAMIAETVALVGYLRDVDWAAKPLLDSSAYGRQFKFGAIGLGLVVPALASLAGPRHSRAATALISLCALVGGLLLRYALVEGGRVSAADPEGYIADTDKPRR